MKKLTNAEYMRQWTDARKEEWGPYYPIFRKHPQLKKYGLTGNDYINMLIACDGKCEICGGSDRDRLLAVDHCHETGRVRGLLCGNCNHSLGKVKDNPSTLRKMADYLESR